MPSPTFNPAEEALRADPRFVAGVKNLNRARLQKLTTQMERDIAIGINFHNRVEDAIHAKARAGKADPQAEDQLVRMGNEAVKACKDGETAANEFADMLTETGLEDVVNDHVPALFKSFDDNANIQAQLVRFRTLGVRNESLQCARDELAKDDFNVLRLRGADGTIRGLVGFARTAELENLVDIIHRQGLPTIRGRGAVIGGFLTAIFVISILIQIASFMGWTD